MVTINNDNLNVANINHTSVVEKIAPAQKISSTRDLPARHEEVNSEKLDDAVRELKLDDAVRKLNEHIQVVQRELHFSVDEDSGQTVIKVMDLATKEVIRQIPNEEALSFARKLNEGVELELLSEYI